MTGVTYLYNTHGISFAMKWVPREKKKRSVWTGNKVIINMILATTFYELQERFLGELG